MFAKLALLITFLMAPMNANVSISAQKHADVSTNISAEARPNKNATILQQVALRDKKLRTDARKAAVSVITPYGSGSGTYFKIGDDYVVITAYHVIEEHDVVLIVGRNNEQVYGQPIIKTVKGDMAVLVVPRMTSVTPMRLKLLPGKAENNVDKLVGTDVTHTGFPGHHDLLTVDGKIANLEEGYIIMHSYGWPGSSGAGVFDFRGRFVGVVSAVDLGLWHPQIPPTIVEDMVWVSPSWNLSAKQIKSYLKNRGAAK